MDVTLTITLHDRGDMTVSGPIHDKILAFGLLEAAKDVIRDTVKADHEKRIIQPHPLLNLKANGGGHG